MVAANHRDKFEEHRLLELVNKTTSKIQEMLFDRAQTKMIPRNATIRKWYFELSRIMS